MKIERNHVYVIPPTHDLSMVDGYLALHDARAAARPARRHRPVLPHAGRGAPRARDRHRPLGHRAPTARSASARIKEHGGIAMAQSPDDAEYDGMPRSAIATGKVDIVLPVAEMPRTAGRAVAATPGGSRCPTPTKVRHASSRRSARRRAPRRRCATS